MRVRFLVDAQLPPALVQWLRARGHEAEHVVDLGLASAGDRTLWARAGETSAVIVTKDEDFVALSTLDLKGPPVVWLRVGNTTTRALLAWLAPVFPDIERALVRGESLVEVTR